MNKNTSNISSDSSSSCIDWEEFPTGVSRIFDLIMFLKLDKQLPVQ